MNLLRQYSFVCWIVVLTSVPLPVSAQWTLYACMATTRNWVAGAKLLPSGVFKRDKNGQWIHVGFNHPYATALDFDQRDSGTMYLAAGNGLIRLAERGARWRILTGSDVTELHDVAVDPKGAVYFAHTAGIRLSRDGGTTWQDASAGLQRKYTESVRTDRSKADIVIAGTEDGLWRSDNAGTNWRRAGAAGLQIMHIEQSPHDSCLWLAATQGGGLFRSDDCAVTFENSGSIAVGRNLYDIAFDPTNRSRIAIAGFGFGIAVSEDGGRTWAFRNAGLPAIDSWSVSFDPEHSGRMYASVHEEALYVSNDAGKTWVKDGLEGSIVYRMRFVPEGAK